LLQERLAAEIKKLCGNANSGGNRGGSDGARAAADLTPSASQGTSASQQEDRVSQLEQQLAEAAAARAAAEDRAGAAESATAAMQAQLAEARGQLQESQQQVADLYEQVRSGFTVCNLRQQQHDQSCDGVAKYARPVTEPTPLQQQGQGRWSCLCWNSIPSPSWLIQANCQAPPRRWRSCRGEA